ncbi:hypothetical protein Acr_12g0002620 [Actinidia rufa]|uniref:Uncharacterized protein n=1 Tax=Actinidia rufa TaxID=165716 RepID=A0A7J0FGB4_9ERIC|nr:hypothetical protein Acr_12g0002620 [Actinidia rufa]
MENPAMAEKLLQEFILPIDKEVVNKLDLDMVITRYLHLFNQTVVLGSSLVDHGAEEVKGGTRAALERHKKEMAKLKRKEALAKTSMIEEFKSLYDFKEAVEGAASTYFGKGFDLCKKQIGLLHPSLDIQDLQIDLDLVEEDEEEEKDVPDTSPPQ